MLYAYFFTLIIPLVLSFILDDHHNHDSGEFFTFFSLNKALFFINGLLLGQLSGLDYLTSIMLGAGQVTLYYYAMKFIRRLEYNPGKTIVLPGATGVCYTTIGDSTSGKVLIAGEIYRAVSYSSQPIGSFSPIKVVDKLENDILIVEELISRRE